MTFMPREPSATAEELSARAEDFRSLFGRITGSSGELYSGFNSTSMTFSDLIASDIQAAGAINRDQWSEALLACSVAAEIIDEWGENVEWYRDRIESYRSQLQTTAPYLDSGDDANGSGDSSRAIFVASLQTMADQDWATLEEKAEDRSSELNAGTDPSNVAKLIDSGRLGWLPYNLMGDRMPMPLDGETGDADGKTLEELIESGSISGGEYNRIMRNIDLLNERAESALRRGEELSKYEIEYLESVFKALEGLEATRETEGGNGVIAIPELIEENISDEGTKEAVLAALGTGILALSNERLGGGDSHLPESVSSTARGPHLGDPPNQDVLLREGEFGQDLTNLSILLGSASERMEGGVEFSQNITLSMGALLDEGPGSMAKEEILLSAGDETISALLDVATLNAEANHGILTGEYANEDLTEEQVERIIDVFLSHGEKVDRTEFAEDDEDFVPYESDGFTQLFDWISDPSVNSDQETQQLAAESVAALVDHMTSPDRFDDFNDGGLGRDAADSLADAFEAHIFSFASDEGITYITDGSKHAEIDPNYSSPGASQNYGYDEDNKTVSLGAEDRLRFLELLMQDESSATKVFASTALFSEQQIIESVETGNVSSTPGQAGTLTGLVESAHTNDALQQDLTAEEEKKKKERTWDFASDLILGSASNATPEKFSPIVDAAGNLVSDVMKEKFIPDNIENDGNAQTPNVSLSPINMEARMEVYLLEELIAEYNSTPEKSPNPLKFIPEGADNNYVESLENKGIITYPEGEGGPIEFNSSEALEIINEISREDTGEGEGRGSENRIRRSDLINSISSTINDVPIEWVNDRTAGDLRSGYSNEYGDQKTALTDALTAESDKKIQERDKEYVKQ
ncbi:hypothetical protein ABZ631_07620 [Nocardiopsis alba]|uniref:TPR repeat region-containing protein n=1 Tax=Nocardiopsis alba TaxID=53437 RepID=UPI0034101207